MAKRVALLVGWTGYGDGRLMASHDGATLAALAEALRQAQHGRFDSVRLLVEQTAVDAQIAIATFLEQPRDPDDLLLLYLSGHCLFVGEEAVLAASDTFSEPYLDATTIQAEFLKRRLRQCPARALLLLDLVHSRADGAPEPEAASLLARAFAAPEYALFLAERPSNQPELPIHFTQALAAGLRNLAADKDGDGSLTLHEWFSHTAAQVPTASQHNTAEQAGWVITAVSPDLISPPMPLPQPTTAASPPANQRTLLGLALLALLLLLFGALYASNRQPATTIGDPSPAPGNLAAQSATGTPTGTPTGTAQAVPTTTSTTTPEATVSPTRDQPPATRTATPPPAATNRPTATATETSLPTPPASPTATPAPLPMEIVAEAAFLRSGPGIYYRIIGFPLRGTAVTAVARSGDANWYNVILTDGQIGWIYTDVVRPADAAAGAELPIAATIPAPADEFYDFSLQDNGQTLIAQVYHVYVGTRGQEAFLRARLLSETDQVQPNYLNGTQLGLGLFIVEFARSGAEPYRSSQVEFCMVDVAGTPFFCQTFPVVKEW